MINRETINKAEQAIKLVMPIGIIIFNQMLQLIPRQWTVTFLNSSTDANSKTEVFKNHTYMLDTKLRLYKCASYTDTDCINESKRIAKIAYDVFNDTSQALRKSAALALQILVVAARLIGSTVLCLTQR